MERAKSAKQDDDDTRACWAHGEPHVSARTWPDAASQGIKLMKELTAGLTLGLRPRKGKSHAKKNVIIHSLDGCPGSSSWRQLRSSRVDRRSVKARPINVVDHMGITAKTTFLRPLALHPKVLLLVLWSSNFVNRRRGVNLYGQCRRIYTSHVCSTASLTSHSAYTAMMPVRGMPVDR